jgi:predicted metalloprotease with PDZ domain
MRKLLVTCVLLLASFLPAGGSEKKDISYTLRVDRAESRVMNVSMEVPGAARTFVIAAAAHPEYDDKYWRYIEDLTASGGTVTRLDSVRWEIRTDSDAVTIHYRVRIPAMQTPRASWRAYVDSAGGLIGGPHAFLYVVGRETSFATVKLELPQGWRAATALSPTRETNVFTAANMHELMESPILVGNLREWDFNIGGILHRVVYAPQPNATPFDTAAFVAGIRNYAAQAIALFGGAPYREFTFLFRDDSWTSGLEHPASVSLGAPSVDLARNTSNHLYDTAHEYFHTWNLMSIKPIEYRDVDYRVQGPVAGLWFSEGLTMFYADLLLRRAGGAGITNTRAQHLASTLQSYLSSPGNLRFSAEHVSRLAYNAPVDAFGDYDASTHRQGEVIGTALDMIIRDATNGGRSIDDVMRTMYERHRTRGFSGSDVERAVSDVCGCSVAAFFDAHVRGSTPVDYNRYLALLGLRANVEMVVEREANGAPMADRRIWSWNVGNRTRLRMTEPESAWGKAGLHSGDELVSVNGTPVRSWLELRGILGTLKLGDRAAVRVIRNGNTIEAPVMLTEYSVPRVTIEELPNATARQRSLREAWMLSR